MPDDKPFDALWIWGSGDVAPAHHNEYVYLRKAFTLPAAPKRADVRVTADNRYKLFVNGQFIARGPARCRPDHQAYDELDLAPYCKRGRNVIAVIAHHFGESTFQSLERGGWGFLLDGEVICRDRKRISIRTDGTWKGRRATAYSRKTSRLSVQLGFQEDFDAAAAEPDWHKPDFDDSHWPGATIYGAPETLPFAGFEARGIPLAREEDQSFVAIKTPMSGRNAAPYQTTDNVGLLLAAERRRPTNEKLFTNPAAAIRRRDHMTVRPTRPGRFAAIVLDAGHETAGYLQLDVEAAGGEIIDVYYTEHVRPDGTPVVAPEHGEPVPMADRYRCRKGRQRHEFFAWKGFRYVLLVFRDVHRPLKVHRIGYRFTSYPLERRGSFACSDPLLDRIWETGAWTQQLCMHDAYMDCPWREQAQWWGDARVQWRVNQAVFGDAALFKRGLRQAAQSQTCDGLTYGLFPCECHHCILPDYTLVWIASIWDYYGYTADDEPVAEHFAAVERALTWFESHRASNGLLGPPPRGLWLFLDWSPLDKAGYNATYNLQYLEALRIAALMAKHLRKASAHRRYAHQAKRLEAAIQRTFWDHRRKVFRETVRPKSLDPVDQIAQHANSLAIRLGLQPKHHEAIAENTLIDILHNHDALFAKNTFANSWQPGADHPIASPFFYAYVLEALCKINRPDEAMYAIRTLWPRMFESGATTWYETWNHSPSVYGSSSACHAWSASPTYHLSEQIGGVTPTAPGFDRVTIRPHAFDLDWADVTTPTRHGPIRVEWRRTPGKITGTIRLPRNINARVDWFGKRQTLSRPGIHRFTTTV